MAYYRIEFLTREANNGWYTHLPVCYQVTTDLKQASEWFDLAVKNLSRQYGNTFESVDRDMKKKDLRALTGLSSSTIAKMTKNETVSTDVLVKICAALNCEITDIMDIIETTEENK